MKTCNICKRNLPYNEYYKTVLGTSCCYCKSCHKIKAKISKWKKRGWDINKPDERVFKIIMPLGKKLDVDPNVKRVCVSCKEEQDYEDFYTSKNVTMSSCKKCISHYNKTVRNKRRLNKLRTDPNYKLAHILRNRFRKTLKRSVDSNNKAVDLLGCTLPEFKIYIEKQFKKGMSWDNYGKWHVDHVLPISKFDFTVIDQQKQCWHFTNLQPLWAKDNISKHNKIKDGQFKILM